jgi:outer membrane usher protein
MSTRRAAAECEPVRPCPASAFRRFPCLLPAFASGPRLRASALALLALGGTAGRAQEPLRLPPAASQAADVEMIVTVRSNGVRRGEFTLLRKANGDIWIAAADLPRMDIQPRDAARREQDGHPWFSAGALGATRVALDEATLTLDIDFRPDVLEGSQIDLSTRPPRMTPAEARTSLLLSYQLTAAHSGGERSVVLLDTDANLRMHGILLRQEMHAATITGTRHVRRGVTQVIKEDYEHSRRYVAGDVLSSAGAYGSGMSGAGILIQKSYELTPDVVRQPTATLQAATALPADVDVSVDGASIYRGRVAPGPIVLNNVLLGSGTRNLRVTVTDIAGNRQVFEQPFLFTDVALAKGFHDYSYFVGKRSLLRAGGTWAYLEPAWQGYHRYGVSDSLTVGGGGEGNADFHNLGAGITLRSDRLGLLSADVLGSTDTRAGTHARGWSARYTYQTPTGTLVLARRAFGEHFRTFVAGDVLFPRAESRIGINGGFGRVSLSADWVRTHTEAAARDARFLRAATVFATNLSLGAEYQTSHVNGVPAWAVSIFLRADLSGRRWASSNVKKASDSQTLEVTTGKQLPQGEGFGYRVGVLSDLRQPEQATSASVSADWNLREASLGVFALAPLRNPGSTFVQASVAGALAGIDGYWGLTRQVSDAFALVKLGVPQAGVQILLNNQPQGRTDGHGRLLVPELSSVGRQDISLDAHDLDIRYTLPQSHVTIVPAYRSGHVVEFGIRQLRAVTGTAWIAEGGARKPVSSRSWTMEGPGGRLAVETTSEGEFYVEDAPPGAYAGRLAGAGGRMYTCRVTLPETNEPVGEVKEGIVCE